jgi:uncharacterized lipoprotein YddW (UPF0748 family)
MVWKWKKWGVLVSFGMAIALLVQMAMVALATVRPAIPETELRGVWLTNVDSDVLFSYEALDTATRRLQQLNFNTIYPTVWQDSYTLYPSAVAATALGREVFPEPGLQGRDMLAEAVELGHRRNLAVIPWFEFGLMATANSDLVQQHPDWVTRRQDGSEIFMQGDYERVWLNPAHPEVRQFLVDLVTEVVTNYEIDGIQFDDHFGMPVDMGYDDYTVQLYQQDHGGDLPPSDPTDPWWMTWRARQITTLMVEMFFAVKNQNPDCIFSLAPNPGEFAYENYLQDWFTWERLGFIEELIVQVYRLDMERFLFELERSPMAAIRSHVPLSVGILTGLRVLPVEMDHIANQVWAVRDRQFAGMSFFFYGSLGDRDTAFQELFPAPAARPDLRNYFTS